MFAVIMHNEDVAKSTKGMKFIFSNHATEPAATATTTNAVIMIMLMIIIKMEPFA